MWLIKVLIIPDKHQLLKIHLISILVNIRTYFKIHYSATVILPDNYAITTSPFYFVFVRQGLAIHSK